MRPEFRLESYDSDVVRHINTLVQAEYQRRYGDGDATVLAAADFVPPAGAFFVAYLDGEPVASGAWRSHGPADAEMKRLYVADSARGLGLARAMVTRLETDAAAAGRTRMILETGTGQPEALALYASMGYAPVEPFGFYANEEGARHLGKPLAATHKSDITAASSHLRGMVRPGTLKFHPPREGTTPMRRRTVLAGAFGVAAAGGLLTAGTALAGEPSVNGVSPVKPSPANDNGIQVATKVIDRGGKFPTLRTERVDTKAEKVLEIDYQVQETGYWCGPAATRMALSARVAAPSQATLAAELGTHTGGTDHISQVTTVMNNRIDTGTYYTVEMPNDPPTQGQVDKLWADVTDDINNGFAVVANIVAPPGNQPPGYPPDQTIYHYFTVIGYNSDQSTVLIGDSASFSGYQIYWLTFHQLSTLIPPKGYSY